MDKDVESTMHFLHLLQRSMAAPSRNQQLQLEGNEDHQQQQQRLFRRIIKRNSRFLAFGRSGGDPVFAAVLHKHTASILISQLRGAFLAPSNANYAADEEPCLANLQMSTRG